MKQLIFITHALILLMTSCTPLIPTSIQVYPNPSSVEIWTQIVEPQATAVNVVETVEDPKSEKATAVPNVIEVEGRISEILSQPTNSSITVNLISAETADVYIEYGLSSGDYSNKTETHQLIAGMPVDILLEGLKSETRYYYRIRDSEDAGPEHTFITQRQPGSTFTFAVQGDSHPERVKNQFDPELYTTTLRSIASDQPDLFFRLGDDFSVDNLKVVNAETVTSLYVAQRLWLSQIGAPVFLVNGNHEQASLVNLDGTADNVAVWAQNARNSYFPQPAPDSFYSGNTEPVEFIGLLRDYYSFTWGDALFVVIDPYWHSPQTVDNQFGAARDQKKNRDLWNVTLGDAQYQWFKQTLETSNSKYKFVFTHHILGTGRGGIEDANQFEWGDSAGLTSHRPGWDKTIHQIMADNGVTVFFQGHDHIFARQELDGVIYQTLPEPANPYYTYENQEAYKSGEIFPNSGHVRVTVSPNGVTVDYVRSYLDRSDEVAYSYSIP